MLLRSIILLFYIQNENDDQQLNGANGYPEKPINAEKIEPGTSLCFDNYDEKSVLVSANYGSTSIWIRFVGQSADVSLF